VTSASLDLIGCFDTYEAALVAGIGHPIDVGAVVAPQTLTDEALPTATITASVLIGTEYDGSGFAGSSNSYFASSTCTSSTTWQGGQRRCKAERPIPVGQGVRRLRHQQEVPARELRRDRQDLHTELHRLRNAVE
jgi:hypothetical protein